MAFSSGYSATQIWEATLGQLLLRVTRQNYDTWLRNTVGVRFDGTTLVVAAPNDLTCDWLSARMKVVIAQSVSAIAGPGLQVRFEPVSTPISNVESAPLQPSLLPRTQPFFNPRYTFETYLSAGFNSLALCAARDLSNPDCAYSPLFITGPSGSGKTHLLHAIAHAARQDGSTVLLVGAEQFLSEYTTSIRNHGGASFRARYRELDMLIIDDVHLLLGKKATLAEFYQTVADLADHGRRVVVSGDVAAMNGEAARFQSELHWGLVAVIEQPNVDDRVRFVQARATVQGICLPDEVQHYLALRVKTSIRDLEGSVNRVSAIARISTEPITIEFAARALQPATITPVQLDTTPAPTALMKAVANHMGIPITDITGSRRDRASTYARHVTMYLLRQDGGMTYSAIAQLMGKKDHSTVVHACTQIHKELPVSATLRADIDAIRTALRTSTNAA